MSSSLTACRKMSLPLRRRDSGTAGDGSAVEEAQAYGSLDGQSHRVERTPSRLSPRPMSRPRDLVRVQHLRLVVEGNDPEIVDERRSGPWPLSRRQGYSGSWDL